MTKGQFAGNPTASFANIGLPSKSDEEKALDMTMRALAKDRYNVHAREDLANRPAQATLPPLPGNRTGWANPRPLENPAGVETLRIIDRMLPATPKEVALSTGAQKIKQLVEVARAHIKENEQLIAEMDADTKTAAQITSPPSPSAGLRRRKL